MEEPYHHCSSSLILNVPTFIKTCSSEQVITPELGPQSKHTVRNLLAMSYVCRGIRFSVHGVKGFNDSVWLNQFLNSDRRLTYQLHVLRVLGLLSILLPLMLIAGSATIDNCTVVLASLSHYYYTSMGYVFLGVLYATGLSLFLYKGDNRAELIATRFASVCIILVALLPTSKDIYGCSTNAYSPNALGEELHKAFAAFFLLTMSTLFYLFARGSSTNKQVSNRNRLYRVCAATIAVIVFTIVALSKPGWLDQKTQQQLLSWTTMYKPVFWLEWLALAAVGTSWLTKGQWLLADPIAQSPFSYVADSYKSEQPALAKANVEEI